MEEASKLDEKIYPLYLPAEKQLPCYVYLLYIPLNPNNATAKKKTTPKLPSHFMLCDHINFKRELFLMSPYCFTLYNSYHP